MSQVPVDYFSKRLGGYLISKSRHYYTIRSHAQIHSLNGSHFSSKGHILTCPLLPRYTKGGFVGAVTMEVEIRDSHVIEYAFIVFGFPPSLTKPFAHILRESAEGGDRNSNKKHDFDSDPLRYSLQRYAKLEQAGFQNGNSGFTSRFLNILSSLNAVLYAGNVFTQLDISAKKMFSGRN